MNIIGHDNVREKLKKLVLNNMINHAYLFYGPSGVGKKLVALEFAKNLMCLEHINGEACLKCESCLTFENNSDLKVILPEKNVIKVDMIREFENEVYLKPTNSFRKCFIIDDADLMNESAQNALLKILEEPPIYAVIILIASNKELLLNTIKSRVTTIAFSKLSDNDLMKILGNDFSEEIISYSKGSVQNALDLTNDNCIDLANELVNLFYSKDFITINNRFNELKKDKDFKDNLICLLDVIILVCSKKIKDDIPKYVFLIDVLNETINSIKKNANIDLALDNMMINICEHNI